MPGLQRFEHLGDQRGFVLQVAVHDDDHLAVRGLHAPMDGRGEAALLDALDAPDIVVAETEARTASAVPSGELSSTTTSSQAGRRAPGQAS